VTLKATLERAAADEDRGDLGKARDRLEGLVAAYPDELEIRRRLGDIYWRLSYPERAGLHWYLLESDRPEMDDAKRAFEKRHGDDAWLMLDAIGYQGGLDAIRGTYAETVIGDLSRRAGVTPAKLEAALRRRNPNEPTPPTPAPWWDALFPWGCGCGVLALFGLAIVGLITVFGEVVAHFWR
jgi:hypothetical protein